MKPYYLNLSSSAKYFVKLKLEERRKWNVIFIVLQKKKDRQLLASLKDNDPELDILREFIGNYEWRFKAK